MTFLAFAFLAGLVSATGFQPWGLWPLTLAAFAFLLWLVEEAPGLRSALARGWWFGVGQFVFGLNWIATAFTFQAAMPAWLGWIAVLLLSLVLALYPAAAAGLAWRSRSGRSLAFILFFAAAWTITEYLRANLLTGFAWNPIGVVLIDRSVAPVAAVVGTYGLSAIVILMAGILRLVVQQATRRDAVGLALAVLAAQAVAWLAQPVPAAGSGQDVRIVQPNIGQEVKWSPEFAERNMARLAGLSRSAGRPGDGSRPRLLIWPESAVTEPLQDGRRLLAARLETQATRREVARAMGPNDLLLTGGLTFQSQDGIQASSATNSVFIMRPDGQILARYDKAHLVPFGEYLPMRPLLSVLGLSRLAPGDLDFDPGPGPQTLNIPGIGAVGFQLCYEIIFSGEVVDRQYRPAFLFNPSNDAWFGAWGPPQHLAQARLRALEEGVPILRATPTGISAVIDARGRLVESLKLGEAGVIDAALPMPAPPTLFSRLGNLMAFGFAFVLAILGFVTRRRHETAGEGPLQSADNKASART